MRGEYVVYSAVLTALVWASAAASSSAGDYLSGPYAGHVGGCDSCGGGMHIGHVSYNKIKGCAVGGSSQSSSGCASSGSQSGCSAKSLPADCSQSSGCKQSSGCGQSSGCSQSSACNQCGCGCASCCGGCNGSYKFPVPPLYTYHWIGMYSQGLMTDYHSPWRFPPIKPFGTDELDDELPPAAVMPFGDVEQIQPVAAMVVEQIYSGADIEPMSQKMKRFYR